MKDLEIDWSKMLFTEQPLSDEDVITEINKLLSGRSVESIDKIVRSVRLVGDKHGIFGKPITDVFTISKK